MFSILHAHSQPDVVFALNPWEVFVDHGLHLFVALGEDLIDVPVCPAHGLEDRSDELKRHPLLKEIAHGVHENSSGSLPVKWFIKFLWDKPQIEPLLIGVSRYASPSFSESFCIAMLASRADFRTSRQWVP